MPHFGLIDNNAVGPTESLLMRAKLHVRSGKRRLHQGKISLGILTLYDALNSALQWYVSVPEQKNRLEISKVDDLNDDRTLFSILVRSRIIEKGFDYESLNELVDWALKKDMSSYDYGVLVKDIESIMTQIGVMPFNENELPPEAPDTV